MDYRFTGWVLHNIALEVAYKAICRFHDFVINFGRWLTEQENHAYARWVDHSQKVVI